MKERYAGEYAPDLRGAIDSYGNDDNPDYLNNLEKDLSKDSSIAFVRRMVINVPDKEFDHVFYGEELEGKVEEKEA